MKFFTKDSLIRAARTAVFTFIAVFGVSLLGFIADVATWAGSVDKTFPSINPLGKAAVGALCAAASGLVGLIVNAAEDHRNSNGLFGAKAKPDFEPAVGGGYPDGTGEANSSDPMTATEFEALLDDSRKKTVDAVAGRVKRLLGK